MAIGEEHSCEESEEELDGNVCVERTYDAYSVRDPCSHRERYIRAAQMDLVVKKVNIGRVEEGSKDGQNSDCMEETKKMSTKILSAVIRTIFLPDPVANICQSNCQRQKKSINTENAVLYSKQLFVYL